MIDATETPIERPKKGQKRFYSGKKKRHTLKSQLVVDPKTKAIICTKFAIGKEHDFHLFKRSRVKLRKETKCLADKGYQGIHKLHANSQLPKKKRKGEQLSQLDREKNQSLERTRGICERIKGIAEGVQDRGETISKPKETIWVEVQFDCRAVQLRAGPFQAFLTYAKTLLSHGK